MKRERTVMRDFPIMRSF